MLFRLVVKQAFGQTTACGHGDRRQLDGAGIIAHRVDARHVGVLELINDDVAFIVGFNARCRQVEVIGRRFAANRPNQAIYGLAAAIFQRQSQAAVGILDYRLRNCVRVQLWAFGVHHFHQSLNDQRIEAAQRRVFTHEQVGFRAEAVNHAGQFNGNIARADYRYALRQRRQFEETVGINTVFHTWNVRVARAAAGGD